MMKKVCTVSGKEFEITDADVKFYEKMSIPTPTLCPEERLRKRIAWRNERKLYRRKCDCCQNHTIAMYDNDTDFPVYCWDCWMSDKWDSKKFGRDIDFSISFFEQFAELLKIVPKLAIINDRSENSEYTHFSDCNKNCFLVVGTSRCEDSFFGYRSFDTKDCTDYAFLRDAELCYQCIEGENLYDSIYCLRCKNSQNLYVCNDCQNCKNCFGCTNLRNKEFYWGNQQLSSEEFFKRLKKQTFSWEDFNDLRKSGIFRAARIIQSENCTGENIENSKNCHQCFDIAECDSCNYLMSGTRNSHCSDTEFIDQSSWCWNGASHEKNNDCICCSSVWYSNNVSYSENSGSSHDLFGCVGMQHAQYCILNKQYTKEEYFILRDKIIEHMKQTGEWGEFFPIDLSPFPYNETVAKEYFPMTKEEVLAKGWKWRDDSTDKSRLVPTMEEIPNDIQNTPDSICNEILACKNCTKNYKIQKAELKFYQKMNLPVPHKCPDCRHIERMKLRNPRKLWERKCDKCNTDIQTTFDPQRPEKVYCEKCYLDSLE